MNSKKVLNCENLTDLICSFLNIEDMFKQRTLNKTFHKSIMKYKHEFQFICRKCESHSKDTSSLYFYFKQCQKEGIENDMDIFQDCMEKILFNHLEFRCINCQTRCNNCNELKLDHELCLNNTELVCKNGCISRCQLCINLIKPEEQVILVHRYYLEPHIDYYRESVHIKSSLIYGDNIPVCQRCFEENMWDETVPFTIEDVSEEEAEPIEL